VNVFLAAFIYFSKYSLQVMNREVREAPSSRAMISPWTMSPSEENEVDDWPAPTIARTRL